MVDAGDAGIRVSGNLLIAAPLVLNAANIQVQGTAVGIPVVMGPNVGALTAASSTAGSAARSMGQPTGNEPQARPSVIIVEVLGYGGQQDRDATEGDGRGPPPRRSNDPEPEHRTQNPDSAVQVIGAGPLSPRELQLLTDDERGKLD